MNPPVPVPFHISRAQAAAAPLPPGRLSALLLRHGSMSLRWYAPPNPDPQSPHDQDEVYIVASGSGRFLCGTETAAFGPGDALFVPASVVHRFLDCSADCAVWVVFYGPQGGELGGESAG